MSALSRAEYFENLTTDLSVQLFSKFISDSVILNIDGTYVYIQKGSKYKSKRGCLRCHLPSVHRCSFSSEILDTLRMSSSEDRLQHREVWNCFFRMHWNPFLDLARRLSFTQAKRVSELFLMQTELSLGLCGVWLHTNTHYIFMIVRGD